MSSPGDQLVRLYWCVFEFEEAVTCVPCSIYKVIIPPWRAVQSYYNKSMAAARLCSLHVCNVFACVLNLDEQDVRLY